MRQKEERYFCKYLAERENKKRKSGILETEKPHHITTHSLALGLGTWDFRDKKKANLWMSEILFGILFHSSHTY